MPNFRRYEVADDLRAKIQAGALTGQLPSRAKLAEEMIGHALSLHAPTRAEASRPTPPGPPAG
jgi:hypothetical protein